jgi:hypothetical protein
VGVTFSAKVPQSVLDWVGNVRGKLLSGSGIGGGFFGDVNVPGYECAWAMLAYPFGTAHALLHPSIAALEAYFAGLISGLINPVFLVAAITRSAVLRIVLLCMVPFCWIMFLDERLYPREGHLLWISGMVLVLFSVRSRAQQRSLAASGRPRAWLQSSPQPSLKLSDWAGGQSFRAAPVSS